MAEVESDAALVAIAVEEKSAFAAFGDRTEFAILAAFAALDSNDISAEVRQQHRAIRPGYEAAKVDDSNSFKRPGHIARHRTLFRRESPRSALLAIARAQAVL
jgi:hypothetical protein